MQALIILRGQIDMKMKLIMESFRGFLEENATQPLKDVPGNLYHAVDSANLDGLRDNGIINLPSQLEFEEGSDGVPCSLDMEKASKHGDVVLEIDGEGLVGSGEYVMNSRDENGVRIGMTDSAYSSGHGVHDMVDNIGTNIPFQYVKRMIFSGDTLPNVRKLKDNGFAGVEIATYDGNETEGPRVMYTPPQIEDMQE